MYIETGCETISGWPRSQTCRIYIHIPALQVRVLFYEMCNRKYWKAPWYCFCNIPQPWFRGCWSSDTPGLIIFQERCSSQHRSLQKDRTVHAYHRYYQSAPSQSQVSYIGIYFVYVTAVYQTHPKLKWRAVHKVPAHMYICNTMLESNDCLFRR